MAPASYARTGRTIVPMFALLLSLTLLGWAEPAESGTITIQYQITAAEIDGSPAPALTGTYTVRFSASGPSTITSGPATLLTLAPDDPYVLPAHDPLLGRVGAHNQLSLGHRGRAVHLQPQPTNLTAWYSATWTGTVGAGLPGAFYLRYTLSSWYYYTVHTGFTTTWFTSMPFPISFGSAVVSGQEIQTQYVPEPSGNLPLVVSGLILAAVVTGKRRLRCS